MLFCGDAAGFVDPITGEGIAYAMQSGTIAANTVADALEEQLDVSGMARRYSAALEEITSSLKSARFWRWLIFPQMIQQPLAPAFADASTLQRGYLDILSGERDYHDLPKLIGQQAAKGLRKLVLRMGGALHRPAENS